MRLIYALQKLLATIKRCARALEMQLIKAKVAPTAMGLCCTVCAGAKVPDKLGRRVTSSSAARDELVGA